MAAAVHSAPAPTAAAPSPCSVSPLGVDGSLVCVRATRDTVRLTLIPRGGDKQMTGHIKREVPDGGAGAGNPMAMCATTDRVVALVGGSRRHIIFTRPYAKKGSHALPWERVATLPAWAGPAPIAALTSGAVAVAAGDKVYFLSPELLRGGDTAPGARLSSVALPTGCTACSILCGDERPAVVLADGSVLTLLPRNVWQKHELGLDSPESRFGRVKYYERMAFIEAVMAGPDGNLRATRTEVDFA